MMDSLNHKFDTNELFELNVEISKREKNMSLSKSIQVVTKDKPPINAKHIATSERINFTGDVEKIATIKHRINSLAEAVSASHFQLGNKVEEIHIFELYEDGNKQYLYTLKECEVIKAKTDFGIDTYSSSKNTGLEEFEFSYKSKVLKDTMSKWMDLRTRVTK